MTRWLALMSNGQEPVVYHGSDEQRGNYWGYGSLDQFHRTCRKCISCGTIKSAQMSSDAGQEAQGKSGDLGSYEDFL